jgi:hypothetical protein
MSDPDSAEWQLADAPEGEPAPKLKAAGRANA